MRLSQTTLIQGVILAGALVLGGLGKAADARIELRIHPETKERFLDLYGDPEEEWRFETSQDLRQWSSAPGLGAVYGGEVTPARVSIGAGEETRFYRGARTTGLFDDNLMRTLRLTFTNANWQTLLANGRTTGSNTPCTLVLEGGTTILGVGARYKGNTSYNAGGSKKSINLEIDHSNPEARLMGYKTVNLNNAAGDETLMREPIYFNTMNEYAPSPKGSLARLYINDEYWGVYSFVQQENGDLINEWFPSNDGDRWSAPNAGGMTGGTPGTRPPGGGGGGGGGFASAASALSYLGAQVSAYRANYFLKTDNSTNAWERLVRAIDVLNNTPSDQFRDAVETVLAVDRWLWFLAVENVFADDDSYFNKGADYGFYYEPESGRIHPVEHDGNESFTAGDVQLSPVQGSAGSNRPVISKLLAVPELRQRYLAHMRTVLREKFNPENLNPLIDRYRAMSVEAIRADPKKNFTMTGYTNDLAALKNFVRQRHAYLTNHAELRPMGPTILSVAGPATAPLPGEAPVVTARVEGNAADGIESVWLYWRGKSYGRFTSVQMFDDGGHGDGAAGDGVFGGTTTNYPAGTRVRYYVEARAGNSVKTASFFPARAEQETASYRVGVGERAPFDVVINELMASNTRAIADPQGDYDDWIELYNRGEAPADLGGRYLSDDAANPRKWQIPAGTSIPAGGYLIIWADEDGGETPGLHANFKLSAAGERVLLVDTDANENALLDSVEFGAQAADRAYGRPSSNPDGFAELVPTPGGRNP